MDYEQAYKDAMARCELIARTGLKFDPGYIFPELAESEDERMRKAILAAIRQGLDTELALEKYNVTYDDVEAWLEKHKKSSHISETCKGNAESFTDEQKPAGWSEDWREEDIQTRFAFYTYKDDPSVLYLSNVFVEEASRNHGFGTRILRAAEKVAETIGATSISLKVKQNSPANTWYRKNGYGYEAFEDGYDWLEKKLEFMKPKQEQPGVEGVVHHVGNAYFIETDGKKVADCIRGLPSGTKVKIQIAKEGDQ